MELILGHVFAFAVMFSFGVLGGLFFGLYCKIRRKWRNYKSDFWIKIADLFSGILAGLAGFGFLLYANHGAIRFFVLLAITAGFFISFYLIKVVTDNE